MRIAVGVVSLLFGIALLFNVGGLAKWGSRDRWGKRDASGEVKQVQPVWVTRIVGVMAVVIGVVAIAG